MKHLVVLAGFFVFGSVCFAGTWTGVLLDETCVQHRMDMKQPIASFPVMSSTCPANSSTKSFSVILHSGEILKLNKAGDIKAAETIHDEKTPAEVIINGTVHGETIDVQSVHLQ